MLELLGGSEPGGAADIVEAMQRLGLRHTYPYGGYLTDPDAGGGPPPEHVDRGPVAHKIGWLQTSRDDVAIVFTRHGPLVVAVYAQGPIDATVCADGRAVTRAALARGRDR